MRQFSERLIALRKERGMTQNDLAQVCQKQRSTVSGYETASKEPDFELLCQLAEYFGVTTDYLLGREDARTHADEGARFAALPLDQQESARAALASVCALLDSCAAGQDAEALRLYSELMRTLQTYRVDVRQKAACGSDAAALPQLLEAQNSLKGEVARILDALLLTDIGAGSGG